MASTTTDDAAYFDLPEGGRTLINHEYLGPADSIQALDVRQLVAGQTNDGQVPYPYATVSTSPTATPRGGAVTLTRTQFKAGQSQVRLYLTQALVAGTTSDSLRPTIAAQTQGAVITWRQRFTQALLGRTTLTFQPQLDDALTVTSVGLQVTMKLTAPTGPILYPGSVAQFYPSILNDEPVETDAESITVQMPAGTYDGSVIYRDRYNYRQNLPVRYTVTAPVVVPPLPPAVPTVGGSGPYVRHSALALGPSARQVRFKR